MTSRTVLISSAQRYMGPALRERFEALNYRVLADERDSYDEAAARALLADSEPVDVLLANLAEPPRLSPVQDIDSEDWQRLFRSMVDPLMYLVRAAVPGMLARGSGKIIAITSAAPLKGVINGSAYCAARGAQNGFIKAVGMELARSGIQVNGIAQNYINNDTYYPNAMIDSDKFRDHVRRNVPANAVGAASETAALAAYLAEEENRHMVGQIIPLAGGWVT